MKTNTVKNPLSKDGRTLLFTRQDKRSLDILKQNGEFINKKEYIQERLEDIAPYILKCYDWFVNESSKRVQKPDYVGYQIWCSVSPKNCLYPTENEIVYILEVPDSEILYFNGLKWDYILNLHYVPETAEDLRLYEQDIKNKGFKNSFEFINGRYAKLYPEEEKRVINSWSRIFDIENWNIFEVQANIWRIKSEWIKDIIRCGEQMPSDKFQVPYLS
ncbi:DUF3841 domain-containing protein [Treponema pedis]|uniref:DUF3841 domain-containing protein n=1 Tax=Treponema pedis TaxID=409322 RepID=UPI000414449D|nr:DUF3841 domain-containing protein [Treponema pedis]QSI05598.1 DUF3841 domain-containing protein [Treponema pedis]